MNTLIANIRIKEHEIENASSARGYLDQILQSKGENGTLPTPKKVFLTGSYSRGTKISPLDDIDVFYVVGHAVAVNNTWHTIVDCDYKFGSSFLEVDGNISSTKILELIKGELEETYGQSEIKRAGEVVNLYLNSYELGIDIVPAFQITNSNYFLIPNGSGSTRWKKSNPLIDELIITNLDSQHNNLVKDLIRITKYWARKKKIVSPRSYHLEAITYHVLSNLPQKITSHAEGLTYLLGRLNLNNYLNQCPDPTGLSESISSGLSDLDIINISQEAYKAISHLQESNDSFIAYVER